MPNHIDAPIEIFSYIRHLTPASPTDEVVLPNFGNGLKLAFSIHANGSVRVSDVKLSDNNSPSFEPISTISGDRGSIIQFAPRGTLVAVFVNEAHKDRVSFQALATKESDTIDNWNTLLSHINHSL